MQYLLLFHDKSGYARVPQCYVVGTFLVLSIFSLVVHVQGDQKVSVYLMITIQKVTSNSQSVHRLAADRQGQEDTRLTLTSSVIPNSNYVIMVSD
jgi:hypothetical protein